MKFNLMRFSALALIAVFMASCANINIVKRTHRKGYHVDIVKKNDRKVESKDQRASQVELTGPDQKMAVKTPSLITQSSKPEPVLTTNVHTFPIITEGPQISESTTERSYHRSDFRWTGKKKKSYKKPMFSSDDHWSAWVAFFSGAASLMFAFIALVLAFFGYAVWPAAIFFGVVAIVFAILNKKNGWSGQKMRKLGLLFGIIGAGVGLIATIIWAIWLALIL